MKNLDYFFRIIKRYQNNYTFLYGFPSNYLRDCEFMVKKLSDSEFFNYCMGNSAIVNLKKELGINNVKFYFNNIKNENDIAHDMSFNKFYSSEISSFKNVVEDKDKWIFNYKIKNKKWNTLLHDLSINKIVNYNISNYNDKIDLLICLFKLFPSIFVISSDVNLLLELIKYFNIGKIKKKKSYICTISKRSFSEGLCVGRNDRFEFMKNNDCFCKCRYYLDKFKCYRSRIVFMRPYTFITQTSFSNGSHLFKPRSLMIVDSVNLEPIIRDLFSFEYKRNKKLSLLYKEVEDIIKIYERRGWKNNIDNVRMPSIVDFSFKKNLYAMEDDITIYKKLLSKNKTFLDGLNNKERDILFKYKNIFYRLKLALMSKNEYTTIRTGNMYRYIPVDVECLINKHIFSYANYFLFLNRGV